MQTKRSLIMIKRHTAVKHLLMAMAIIAISLTMFVTGARATPPTHHRTVNVDGLDIFYREAGAKPAPTILLLYGFPTSSQMFRNLIPALADQFHVVAPDYPGFGHSAMPTVEAFDYTFNRLADIMDRFVQQLGLNTYSLYVMDYGAPHRVSLSRQTPRAGSGIDRAKWQRIRRGTPRLLETISGLLE